MDYFGYNIKASITNNEVLIALFSKLPFTAFEEQEDGFTAYLPKKAEDLSIEKALELLQKRFDFSYKKTLIPTRNWNEVWESNFEPIVVEDICVVRANFHPLFPAIPHQIIINPKMAFGTGHHATTYMMMQKMHDLIFTNKKILDYGCGTGILSIWAAILGAKTIDAVDIEAPSYENTIENAQINNIDNINTFHGTLEAIQGDNYAIILANINRNVILTSLPDLHQKLNKTGTLLISGILENDVPLLEKELLKHHFSIKNTIGKNGWICLEVCVMND